jgi:GTP cyclohydrolase IA
MSDKNTTEQNREEKEREIKDCIRRVLEYIGEDPDREGLRETPDRILRMWKEIFRGYDPGQKPKITTFDNGKDGIVYDSMIVDEGDFQSNCEHHCVWFWGKYWFAYIPNPKGKILGISKIGRVVDYCAARLQVQERLGHDIVEMLKEALGEENPPLGIAIVMKAHHSCKEFRGVKKKGVMTSAYMEGVFRDNQQLRAELMQLVNNDRFE